MNLFIRHLLLAIFVSSFTADTLAVEPQLLAREQLDNGWIQLFDGQTMFGWQATNDVDWKVADGEIRADKGKPGLLMTTTQFADYELHVEFRTSTASTNSGVFLRTPLEPAAPAVDCVELNIAPPDHPFPTGNLVDRALSARSVKKPISPDVWHTFVVRAEGSRITVDLDGERHIEYSDATVPRRGHIGLQFREKGIAFRNIRLRPIGLKSMFNGTDLTGWKTDQAKESEYSVTSQGELRVVNGRGQIESADAYADFVLQLDCFVDGDKLNSGIFFRCIPGDFMMGYESQIHNGMVDGDPTKPMDHGTGGIFRRQNARRVVARDQAWFTKTIVADGPHMAVWVEGHQVSDWTDTRPLNENPRRGLRTAAGTIAIQGHDPTTDLRFRNLRIAELPGTE